MVPKKYNYDKFLCMHVISKLEDYKETNDQWVLDSAYLYSFYLPNVETRAIIRKVVLKEQPVDYALEFLKEELKNYQ